MSKTWSRKMKVFTFLVFSILTGLSTYWFKFHSKLTFMRLFRNLSRYKARKRLYGNNAALMPLLMGSESDIIVNSKRTTTVLENVDISTEQQSSNDTTNSQCHQEEDTGFYMTLEELATMNGSTETTPIYISIQGYIYDVSKARDMYGPGGSYHPLVGIDGTKAFATGCLEEDCIHITVKESPLTEEEQVEVNRWLDFYKNHDKYEYVGRVIETSVVDSLVSQEIDIAQEN